MKRVTCLFFTLITVLLTSCQSEKGSSDEVRSVKVSESAIDVEAVKKVEIQNIKEQLNSGNYSLSKSELEDLKSEGLLTEEDYLELSKIVQN